MTKDQIDFDSIFKSRGGIFDVSKIGEGWIKKTMDELKKTVSNTIEYLKPSYPLIPDIYIDIIKNESLNACATKQNGKYYFGINSGVLLLLVDMYLKMFSTYNILPEIGNVDVETKEKKTLNARIDNGTTTFDFISDNYVVPKDSTRLYFATAYIRFAMQFLMLHELGHIIRGHVGYITNEFNTVYWNEFDITNSSKHFSDSLNRQTLEMDADSFATNHAFITAWSNIEDYSNLQPPFQYLFKDLNTFYNHWFFVMYTFFRLIGFTKFTYPDAKNLSHPPADVRLSLIIANLSTILIHNNKKFPAILTNFMPLIQKAELAFASISFHDYNPEIFLETFTSSVNYGKEILSHWNTVYYLIKPFAYGNLPPLVKD